MENANFTPENAGKFMCEKCDFKCSKQSDWNRHIMTSKHKKLTNANDFTPNDNDVLECICGKNYKHASSLCKHKKICSDVNKYNLLQKNNTNDIDNNLDLDLDSKSNSDSDSDLEPSSKDIIKMMKMQMIENQEIRSLIIELLKKETISTINNNNNNINNNCNNKSFNLNVFLNEQCKDALNIDEFVDSIKMNLSDLEEFANVGYADGVSNIFSKGIKELGVHLRPIHCSDTKRETLYIKNNDEWVKETDDKPLIIKAIKKVAFKNIKQINEWVKENPSCKDPRTKKYDKYNKIVMNAMSGVTEQEQHDNIEKILKNVTKSVAIDKYALR